jgi:putative DNA primase/helicase
MRAGLDRCGVVATTAMHGANAPVDKTDWSPLAGKSVLIWPDRDKPGWDYATAAAQAILSAGAKSCHILYPPEDKPRAGMRPTPSPKASMSPAFSPRPAPADARRRPRKPIQWPAATNRLGYGGCAGAGLHPPLWHRDWRYVALWGKWLVWDGNRWRTEDTLAATDLIRSVVAGCRLRADNPKVAAKLASASTVGGVERLARSDPQARGHHRGVGCRSVAAQHPGRRGRSASTGRMRPTDAPTG